MPKLKAQCIFSVKVMLTDERMNMLKRSLHEFRTADPVRRERIIEDTADRIETT